MITRQRTCFDAVAHIWRPVVCIDIGRPETTAIPIEQHPAVIEDAAEGPTEELEPEPKVKRASPKGGLKNLVIAELGKRGKASVDEISMTLGQNRDTVRSVLMRNAELFEICEIRPAFKAKIHIWRLKQ